MAPRQNDNVADLSQFDDIFGYSPAQPPKPVQQPQQQQQQQQEDYDFFAQDSSPMNYSIVQTASTASSYYDCSVLHSATSMSTVGEENPFDIFDAVASTNVVPKATNSVYSNYSMEPSQAPAANASIQQESSAVVPRVHQWSEQESPVAVVANYYYTAEDDDGDDTYLKGMKGDHDSSKSALRKALKNPKPLNHRMTEKQLKKKEEKKLQRKGKSALALAFRPPAPLESRKTEKQIKKKENKKLRQAGTPAELWLKY